MARWNNLRRRIKNGKIEGKGVWKFLNGQTYEGEFKNGNPEGKGIQKWPDGQTYEGEWKDNQFIQQPNNQVQKNLDLNQKEQLQ